MEDMVLEKLVSREDFNAIIDYLDKQDFNFCAGDGEIEVLNAKYFSTLFQAIYNGVFSNEIGAIENIICALTLDDIKIAEDKAVVTIYHGQENEYTVDVPKQLGIDMFEVGLDDIYSRNIHGVFKINSILQSEKSIFKTPNKKIGRTDATSVRSYLYKNAKVIIDKVFAGKRKISFKSIYYAGVFHRVEDAGVQLTYKNLTSGTGKEIYRKECERVRLNNPYSVVRGMFFG